MKLKERNNELIQRAFNLLGADDSKSIYRKKVVKGGYVDKAYASQISAFSVSVAMIGLKPTLAMYYEKGGAAVDTNNIVGLIAELLMEDGYTFAPEGNGYNTPAEKMFVHTMRVKDDTKLRKDVIDNAVALKVVVRTFLKNE